MHLFGFIIIRSHKDFRLESRKKRLIAKSRCRWQESIKTGREGVRWILVVQGSEKRQTLVRKVMNCQLRVDATEVFIADLIACSTCFGHHYANQQELKSIIQWLLRVVFCAVVFQVAGLVLS